MSETARNATTYRVLMEVGNDPENLGAPDRFVSAGDHQASSPKLAVLEAVKAFGLPDERAGRAIAVPLGNWHEFPVTGERRLVYEVGEKGGQLPGLGDTPPE